MAYYFLYKLFCRFQKKIGIIYYSLLRFWIYIANILFVITLEQRTAADVANELADRVRARRKSRGFTQNQMAKKAGMSFASYRRFEQTGQIALQSLINIAIALGCEDDFDGLFSQQSYSSIEEVIAANW